MCRPATCNKCTKTTWQGCGEHIDAVMVNVPQQDQCVCAPDIYPESIPVQSGGFLTQLFGKN